MTKNEIKVLSLLIIIVSFNMALLIFSQSEKLLILLQIELQQQKETTIVYSLLGIHALFGLLTMFISISGQKFQYRYISIWGMVLAPLLFFIYHFKTIISYQTDSYYFLPLSILIVNFALKDMKKEEGAFTVYIRTLINPLETPPY